jgi:large subunit ribosomal protein L6
MTRALIANMVTGVSTGFTRELEIVGVGWSGRVQGKKLALSVGYADTKEVAIPDGVTVVMEGSKIKVSGPDKQSVGQFAAQVRSKRKPEPYNGKGIKYSDETIIRKAGKAFGSS